MTSFQVQRNNMVESQVRPSDVTDRRIIRAMSEVPRERFVPESRRFLAYADQDVDVGHGRYLLAPRLVARMIQNLEIGKEAFALEVGTATGYGAALLARIAQTVVALESDPVLANAAADVLRDIGVDNTVVVTGDLPGGHAEQAPYDVILVSGQVADVPSGLLDQLKHGGHLIGVVDDGTGLDKVVRWQRFGETYDKVVMFEAGAPPLPGFQRKAQFAL